MNEEAQNLAEVEPATEQVATAAPEPEAQAPEITEEQPQEKPAKTFTQEELDEVIRKRLAREQRKWEREQNARLQELQAKPSVSKEPPSAEQFESVDAYAEALAAQKAEELLAQREARKQQAMIEDAYAEREEEARNKYDDFEQVAYNPKLPVTDVMAETIKASDMGPDLAYWLGSNPKEADRISRLTPLLQAREIGKIEAKLANEPIVKKTSSAPPPISPVSSRTSSNPSFDTTDPRSVKSLSTSEWIEAERQRQIRKWEAQRNR